MTQVHVHLISDSTGETVHSLAKACLVQFEDTHVVEHSWPLIRTAAQVDKILLAVSQDPGIVLYTLVNKDVRERIDTGCRQLGVPAISVLDPIIAAFSKYLGEESRDMPGRQHLLDDEYFERIEAMQFALNHDDGQGLWNLAASDVILTGVSRTSKSPTCLYLANRGIKASNVPIVPGVPLPAELLTFTNKPDEPLVIGLTKDPARLVQVRRNRLRMISEDRETDYVDLETVRAEVNAARRTFVEQGWPIIDVSRRSIEETAASIMQHLETREAVG
ncbi:kinase/pyrophosphorylase [Hwanghaeella grinnelliae]|uniref:Putative pyruvate, phosphate dikinase regulatory protein n=1 Tax=Hwanghaeella grinnelliae TaxID=2500179 RepID=A0A3S2Z8M3_9PROT|nr:pyruvate, water dikinase regulatory protein [Hwanghaeella grinnelliae]RVU36237.1 kinase/pyrophosphorylase [Hwanghaeella grinnelliae]